MDASTKQINETTFDKIKDVILPLSSLAAAAFIAKKGYNKLKGIKPYELYNVAGQKLHSNKIKEAFERAYQNSKADLSYITDSQINDLLKGVK